MAEASKGGIGAWLRNIPTFVQQEKAETGKVVWPTRRETVMTAIIRAVVALAGSLGMKTVAEGVSTEEQLQLVRQLGVDKIQGFIFSRPVTAATVKAMLGQNRKLAAA